MSEPGRIVKAQQFRGLGAQIAFNYDDLREQCDRYVKQARAKADRLLEEARRQAEHLRRKAHQDGLEQGRREGLADAAQEIETRAAELADERAQQKLRTCLPALRQAAESLTEQRDVWLADWEQTAVRLAIAVAEKIVRRRLEHEPEIRTEMIRSVLEAATGSPRITIHLNPHDAESLQSLVEEIVSSISGCGEAAVVADPDVSPGGCLIKTEQGQIDGRLETQLERIASELLWRQ